MTLKYHFETKNRAPFGGCYECEYEYDPSLKDLEKALARILYRNYMLVAQDKIRDLPNKEEIDQSIINGIHDFLKEITDIYAIAEDFEDALTNYFEDDAYESYRSECDYDE